MIGGLGAAFSYFTLRSSNEPLTAAEVSKPQDALEPAGWQQGRVEYPYSIIPGGVKTPEELPARLAADPVAAAHYRGFDATHVRFFRASLNQRFFVSYRVKDTVYWTKKALLIPAGELLYTDGKEVCRARCGNRLSTLVRRPFTPMEPNEPVFDQPTTVAPPELIADLTGPMLHFDLPSVIAPKVPVAAVAPTPKVMVNRVSACCEFGTPRPRKRFFAIVPIATPEPSYGIFSLLAVLALGVKYLWDRRALKTASSAPAASTDQTPLP